MRTKRMMITMMLLVCCIAVVGGIYMVLQPKAFTTNDEAVNIDSDLVVEIIELEEPNQIEVFTIEDKETVQVEETIVVEEIVIAEKNVDGKEQDDDGKEQDDDVIVEETMPEEPDKPETSPPDIVPETKDDVTDMSKEPEYEEEQVTYEEEKKEEAPKDNIEEKKDSNLIPDSQNPFLNPNNAGNPDIREGEDFYENGVPAGQGDKF